MPAPVPDPMPALTPALTPALPPTLLPVPSALPQPRSPAEAAAVDAALLCGGREPHRPVPAIVVRGERLPLPLAAMFQWPAAVAPTQRLALDAARWRAAGALAPRPGDSLLLAAAGEPLIVMRAGLPRRLETVLDFGGTAAGAEGELPLLVDWMFERLLEAPLLDAMVSVERGADAFRVAPMPAPEGSGAAARGRESLAPATKRHDAGRLLTALALALLLWELVALARQWRRLTRIAPSAAPSIAPFTQTFTPPSAAPSGMSRPVGPMAKARGR
jgi:hypothetical protein